MGASVGTTRASHASGLDELRRLAAAIDRLTEVSHAALDPDEQSAWAVAVSEASARLESIRAQVAGAVDDSGAWSEVAGSAAAFLRSLQPNRHRAQASRDLKNARDLRKMPLVAESFAAGRITGGHVKKLGECLHPRFEDQFADFETELLGHAEELPFDLFVRLIDQWKRWADDAVDAEQDLKDERAREVHLSRSFQHRGALNGTLTPVGRSVVETELSRLERILFAKDWEEASSRVGADVTVDALRRTAAQRRHDALVWMAMRSKVADGDRVAEPLVYVHATADDVHDALSAEAGVEPVRRPRYETMMRELEDGTPISRRLLVQSMVRGAVRRLVFEPGSERLELGRSARWFTKAQREAIAARDRWCTCGCWLSSRLCEIDHVREWRDGGTTDVGNGRARCPTSHRAKTNRRNRAGRS